MLPVAILAGGLATRLRPLTEATPKSLVLVHGEPFLAHQLRLLRGRGVSRVVLCVGHLGEMIQAFAGDGRGFGLEIKYSWDGATPLGTAGAIRNALPLLGDGFFVLYGDSYLPCDYQAVERAFFASGKAALMTVFRNDAPWDRGQWDRSNVELRGGRIAAYDKRRPTPPMQHIDYGLGVFRASVFAALPPGPCDLAEVYRDLADRSELAALEMENRFYEIGSIEGIRSLDRFLSTIPA